MQTELNPYLEVVPQFAQMQFSGKRDNFFTAASASIMDFSKL
jgi:hypothetical protein